MEPGSSKASGASWHKWRSDVAASLVVFLVALPLCMGVALASGLPAQAGLITGIVGGIVVGPIAGAPLQVSGPAAGLIAGAALAATPVAALMFRFNNPDALLVLLLVAAAYCTMRATETASTRWMALTGCAVGFAFLTKMLQAFLVVPGFALVFLVAAPAGRWRRIGALLVGAATMVASTSVAASGS